MGKKRNVKKGEKWEKMDLSICIFVAFFLLFRFAFFAFVLLLFCFYFAFFLPGKKPKKSKIKAKQKQKKSKSKKQKKQQKCKWTSPFFSHFFPFLSFLFVSFFSLLFCFCVFWILLICFLVFPFFLHFSRFFSSFKKIRISYGLVNIMLLVADEAPVGRHKMACTNMLHISWGVRQLGHKAADAAWIASQPRHVPDRSGALEHLQEAQPWQGEWLAAVTAVACSR